MELNNDENNNYTNQLNEPPRKSSAKLLFTNISSVNNQQTKRKSKHMSASTSFRASINDNRY